MSRVRSIDLNKENLQMPRSPFADRFRAAMLATAVCLVAGALGASSASAAFGIEPGSFSATATDAAGNELTQAGGHPDATTSFRLNTTTDSGGFEVPDEDLKDVTVDLPVGAIGNPTAVPYCQMEDFATQDGTQRCPTATQVGVARVLANTQPLATKGEELRPIFNLVPSTGEPARLGFRLFRNNIVIDTKLRSASDYGVTATVRNAPGGILVYGSTITLWGVPAAAAHDDLRFMPAVSVPGDDPNGGGNPIHANDPPAAFFTNPVKCGEAQVTRIAATSWQHPDSPDTAQAESSPPTGCDRLSFTPSSSIAPTDTAAGGPTGLAVDLGFGQPSDPVGQASAQLRNVAVTLPQGMSINPAVADGLQGCSDEQLGLKTEREVACPDGSKIGSVTASTPILREQLSGGVYIRSQASDDPQSGEMFRLALVLENRERGILVKLPGAVRVDRQTGQIVTEFADNPQVPVDHVHLLLNSGFRAPLTLPSACGPKTIETTLTSWDGQVVNLHDEFDVPCGNGVGFAPILSAGTVDPLAGKASPFTLRVTRSDGEQNVSRIDATLPEGLLAKLAGVPVCPDAAAASGGCSPASQIGTATVGVGAGSNPLFVPQAGKAPTAVYLSGPYKGAPYSLVVKVPAQAGPFDLGTVAVRSGIYIDPVTAQVSVKSDPLPQILQGIPIAYRDIRVDVNRSDFTLNPTSCDPMSVDGTITSAQGQSAKVSDRFQVANCERLGFKPSLALKLSGPTHRSAYPALKATLTMPKGGANIQRAAVTLPKTEILAQEHIKTICTRVQYAANACPKQSVYGYAKAWSPLLDKPLQGPVYLRSSSHKLPDLVASLDGQIHIDLQGKIDSTNARIRNTFDLVPDAPISKFVLTMQGGRKGLLVNNTELCKATPKVDALFDAQNGKVSDSQPLAKVDCGKGRKGAKK